MNAPQDKSRRGFLTVAGSAGLGAGLGTLALAPGLLLIEVSQANTPQQGASGKVRWGMLIDSTKCATGCDACVKACNTENGINETVKDARQGSQWIRKIDLKDPKTGVQQSLPGVVQAHDTAADLLLLEYEAAQAVGRMSFGIRHCEGSLRP